MSHTRRPSISNWLARSSSSTKSSSSKNPYSPSKPVRISEPKFMRSLDSLNHTRTGSLGSGAQIVRTPQDALMLPENDHEANMTMGPPHLTTAPDDWSHSPPYHDEDQEYDQGDPPAGIHEPELPPLPLSPITSTSSPDILSSTALLAASPPRPVRAPPPPPSPRPVASLESSLKDDPPLSNEFPSVPPLPSSVTSSPKQPPFHAIVVSGNPTSAIDRSKVIICLETETQTHKTTISTLTSRPSHLATFIMSLLPEVEEADERSVYSEDQSMYHRFLATEGMLSKASFTLHIFLDRPSASYAHVLNYLRSSPTAPDTLPRNVKLQMSLAGPSRLDALLDLRDEASYLGLASLLKVCNEELRHRLSILSRAPIRSSHLSHSPSGSHPLPGLSAAKQLEQGLPAEDEPSADLFHGGRNLRGLIGADERCTLRTPVSLSRRSNGTSTGSSTGSEQCFVSPPRPSQTAQPLTGRWI